MPDEETNPAPNTNRQNRRKMSDAEVVSRFLDNLPPQLRGALAPLLMAVILRERARCTDILEDGVRYHSARVKQIEGGIRSAILGNRPLDELSILRASEVACSKAMAAARRAINVPPGSCPTCNGAKAVPSAVVLSGGQVPMVPCPTCSATPVPATNGASSPAVKATDG